MLLLALLSSHHGHSFFQHFQSLISVFLLSSLGQWLLCCIKSILTEQHGNSVSIFHQSVLSSEWDWVSATETPNGQQLNQSLLPSSVIRATFSAVLTHHTPPFGGAH